MTPREARAHFVDSLRALFASSGFVVKRIEVPMKPPSSGTLVAARTRGEITQAIFLEGNRFNSSWAGSFDASFALTTWFLCPPRDQHGMLAKLSLSPDMGVQVGDRGNTFAYGGQSDAEVLLAAQRLCDDVRQKLFPVLEPIIDGPALMEALERLGAMAYALASTARELRMDEVAREWLSRDTITAPEILDRVRKVWGFSD